MLPQTSKLSVSKHYKILMGKQKNEQGSEVVPRRKWSVLSGGFRRGFILEGNSGIS